MSLETGDFITDLEPTNPTGLDAKSFGDDHLRLIKKCVQQSFPNIDAPVTLTPAQLNAIPTFPALVDDNFFRALGTTAIEMRTPAQVLADIGAAGLANENTFAGDIIISNINPRLELYESDQAADARRWLFDVEGQTLILRVSNDAGSVTRSILTAVRSGNAVSSIAFGNASDDPSFTFNGAGQLLTGVGSAAAPAQSFATDPDNGMYRAGTNHLGLAAGGKLFLSMDGATANDLIAFGDGTRATFVAINGGAGLSRTFRGQTGGLMRWDLRVANADAEAGADAGSNFQLVRYTDAGAAIGNALQIKRDSGQWEFGSNSLNTPATPGVAWHGDPDTGFYRPAGNQVGIAAGGVAAATFTATNTGGLLEAGSYTPTCVNIANCAAITPALCMYQRVGRIVQVSGIISVDPTNNSVLTRLSVSVPIAPANFTLVTDASGHGIDNTDATVDESACWEIFAITGGALLELRCVSIGALASRPVRFSFMYRVSTS